MNVKTVLLFAVAAAVGFVFAATPVQWDLDELGTAPKVFESGYPEKDGVKSLFFEGVPYAGKPTRVFAYLAMPKVAPGKKVPGMVLVHGGLGSAFRRWAKFWAEQGYAAISMDTCGCVSGNEFGNEQSGHKRHDWAGPAGWGGFAEVDKPVADQWTYHAVAAVIRANSLLRSLPEVDPNRIGLTGVSWGGILTCVAAGVDKRFEFAAPVYGCGYLDEDSAWIPKKGGTCDYTPEQFRKWASLFDPRHYLAGATATFLWIDGSNDHFFPLPSLQKSVATPKTPYYRATRVRMPHNHSAVSEYPQELVDFAAFRLKPGVRKGGYPFVRECDEEGGEVSVGYDNGGDEVVRAELEWTSGRGEWEKRTWQSQEMAIEPTLAEAVAELPDEAVAWYVNFFTADGKCFSGELNERTPEEVTALKALRAARSKVVADVHGLSGVDFSKKARDIRPALHSSGWSPRVYPRLLVNDDAAVKALRMTYTRTHDWALVNSGQRMVDTCRIFPLMHLDAKDPKNYVFGPTDEALRLARNVGLKIMYRLGESIEHTEGVHFNVRVPDDYEKYAEVMAGIVRHYNRGWANGYHWNIEYWNFWEEPDGISNLWCLPGPEGADAAGMRKRFIRLFVTVMKRLKAEFPEIKFGGPALISCDLAYFREMIEACAKEGLKPDFISWDSYGQNPHKLVRDARKARRLLDELGCPKTEVVLAEWHYLVSWTGIHGKNATPEQVRAAKYGPTGINQIDSACYALTALSLFQSSPFDQAYYYGCSHTGDWGYLDDDKAFNKPYRALCAFGDIVGDHRELCETVSARRNVTMLAARSADAKRKTLLVTDYRGQEMTLEVAVKGVPADAPVTVKRLDHAHADWHEIPTVWKDGKLVLKKATAGSAAFLATFL